MSPIISPEPLVRIRLTGAYDASGRYQTTGVETKFSGSFQSLSRRDREGLPEGIRSTVENRITAPQGTLRMASQQAGHVSDRVRRKGVVYEVVHVDDAHPLIPHDRAYVVRLQEADPGVSP